MPTNVRTTKAFKLEVLEGGVVSVWLDGEHIPGISSFYINRDASEQDFTIELWKTDDHGNMDIMNIMVAN